jgi:hypothetical protein
MEVVPKAREDRLLSKELGEEVVIYDLDRDEALCLNAATASIWRHCNGKKGLGELAELLAADTGLPADEELVLVALDRLRAKKLLKGSEPIPGVPSRREITLRLGLAAGLLPVILCLPAPSVAQTASCLADVSAGKRCSPNQCGVECGGTTCGTGSFFCKKVGTNKYRCVPPASGTCP